MKTKTLLGGFLILMVMSLGFGCASVQAGELPGETECVMVTDYDNSFDAIVLNGDLAYPTIDLVNQDYRVQTIDSEVVHFSHWQTPELIKEAWKMYSDRENVICLHNETAICKRTPKFSCIEMLSEDDKYPISNPTTWQKNRVMKVEVLAPGDN